MADPVTCHILDTAIGKPAANVTCSLYYLSPGISDKSDASLYLFGAEPKPIAMSKTDNDGRIKNWILDPSTCQETQAALGFTHSLTTGTGPQWSELKPGIYKIKFLTGKYFHELNMTSRTFFPYVEIIFEISNPPDHHYHVPLLLSNFSYSTYRGS